MCWRLLPLFLLSFVIGIDCQPLTIVNGTTQSFDPSLEQLIAQSFDFIPPNSNIFLLLPNQTVQPIARRQTVVHAEPITDIVNTINSNDLDQKQSNLQSNLKPFHTRTQIVNAPLQNQLPNQVTRPNELNLQSLQPQIASIQNGTLQVSNPFASTPYLSDTETIQSLISKLFGNVGLQSLPPEELLFGSLPQSNETVTKTIVKDVLQNVPITNSGQSDTLQPPLEEIRNEIHQSFRQPANVDNQISSFVQLQNQNPQQHTFSQGNGPQTNEQVVSNQPQSPISVSNVQPIPNSISAEFESNRIEPIQTPWNNQNRIVRVQNLPTQSPRIESTQWATVQPISNSFEFETTKTSPSLPPSTEIPNRIEWSTIRTTSKPSINPARIEWQTFRPKIVEIKPATKEHEKSIQSDWSTERPTIEIGQTGPTLPPLQFEWPTINANVQEHNVVNKGKQPVADSNPVHLIPASIHQGRIFRNRYRPTTPRSTFRMSLNNRSTIGPTTPRHILPTLNTYGTRTTNNPSINSLFEKSRVLKQERASNLVKIISLPNYKFYLGKRE